MDYIRLKEIKVKDYIGNKIGVIFMASNVEVRYQKDNVTKLIAFTMVDGSTKEECKLFGATQKDIDTIKNGQVYQADISVKSYDKAPSGYSCIIDSIEACNLSNETFVDIVSAEKINECQSIIQQALNDIARERYGRLVFNIIAGNWGKFTKWVAGMSAHHNRVGELIVHTCEVYNIAVSIAERIMEIYGKGFIRLNLLKAAALLHDIGKIDELEVDVNKFTVQYSIVSSLESHIMGVLKLVEIQAYELNLGRQVFINNEHGVAVPQKVQEQILAEEEELYLLKHILASHHGKLEWGSPITPSVPEAVILHKADELSAEMYRYNKAFKDIEIGTMAAIKVNGEINNIYKDTSKIIL